MGEGREEEAEVEVVEVELGAAVGVGGVDPLAAAVDPVSCIAARTGNHQRARVKIRQKTSGSNNLGMHFLLFRTVRSPQRDSRSMLNSALVIWSGRDLVCFVAHICVTASGQISMPHIF